MPIFLISALELNFHKRENYGFEDNELDMAVFLSCSKQFIKMVPNTKNTFLFYKIWINLYSTHSLIHTYFVLVLP